MCFSCGDGGHRVNRCPQVNTDFPHLPRDGLLNLDNGQYRVTRRDQKLVEGPGNEQRSEREGQPLGPPEIKAPLTQVVSADSSPLMVVGRINLNVAFPGLQCNMCCVVANIGSDGLLGTEALQSCLPHQLDLRTGQLWAEGRSTLQLHQQKPTPDVTGLLLTAVVLPPDSEVVASFSINSGQLGSCALIDPNRDLTEEFGVVVGHTLVDASTPSANVLIINPNAEEVVLPCGSRVLIHECDVVIKIIQGEFILGECFHIDDLGMFQHRI